MDEFKTIPISEEGARVIFKSISIALYEGMDSNSEETQKVIRELKASYPEIAQQFNF